MRKEIKFIREEAVILQSFLCAYGTKDGDGKSCDCKFSKDVNSMRHFSEKSGCAEARTIIRSCDKILKDFNN